MWRQATCKHQPPAFFLMFSSRLYCGAAFTLGLVIHLTMSPRDEKKRAAPTISAPSPPLSASAGASDGELDANVHRQTDSSSLSLASTHLPSRSMPSAIFSFTSDTVAYNEAATRPRGRSGRRRYRADTDAGDVDNAFSLV